MCHRLVRPLSAVVSCPGVPITVPAVALAIAVRVAEVGSTKRLSTSSYCRMLFGPACGRISGGTRLPGASRPELLWRMRSMSVISRCGVPSSRRLGAVGAAARGGGVEAVGDQHQGAWTAAGAAGQERDELVLLAADDLGH